MLPDRVSNPGPLTYESGALPIALRGPATVEVNDSSKFESLKFCCSLSLKGTVTSAADDIHKYLFSVK